MKTYLGLSSLVLAFSFVFSNSLRTMCEQAPAPKREGLGSKIQALAVRT